MSVATIRDWQRKGCPVLDRGKNGHSHAYDSAAVINWRLDRVARAAQGDNDAREMEHLRTRSTAAIASRMEMDLAARSAELAPIDEAAAAVAKEYGIVRAAFRTIPDVAPLLAGKQAPEIQELLADKVNAVLTELSAEAPQ
ncbi:hypothetical protein AXW83_12120 [Bosea sp. PAMC 26642]|nr:hypothetical protein AXW83_12120 [Bosea sp. PAMC 26642]